MNHALRMALLALFVLAIPCLSADISTAQEPVEFRAMAWNIWRGGREDGEKIGPQKVVDIIRQSQADVVAMQETYGSGEWISEELGYHFHPRGTNVSIHSRFPVLEDLSVFEEFKCVGALLQLPEGYRVAFYSIWLPYNAEIWEEGTRDVNDRDAMIHACQASCDDLIRITELIEARLDQPQYEGVPVVIAGDFNSMSHRDYLESFKQQFDGVVMDWNTSRVMTDNRYVDSWRELHPEVHRTTDRTWSPRFPRQQQDRIDFVYHRGNSIQAIDATRIDSHDDGFPSDHAAVVTQYRLVDPRWANDSLRIASYNIKHGLGTDGNLDLDRTAALLENIRADVIGLQEVDQVCRRSGQVNQAEYLGEKLGMNHAFGSFMDYQGGQYGLAVLSKYSIEHSAEIRLPEGNEPRVALACTLQLPNDQKIVVVNLHLDWVGDDRLRFAQAEALAEYLKGIELPYLLLGDFNDVKDSRTLDLLSRNGLSTTAALKDVNTFSSTEPTRQIDFIFAVPADRWESSWSRIYDAPVTSDHRPVLSVVRPKNR